LALNSQINQQLSVRAFARYGIESYDTVRTADEGLAEFSDRRTLRLGIASEYAVSPMLSIFGGVDYIPSSFQEGETVTIPGSVVGGTSTGDYDEDIVNAYIGLSVKFNDYLTGTASYNYTHSTSEFPDQDDYDRNRISLGVSAEF
jgi:hypothetical protein